MRDLDEKITHLRRSQFLSAASDSMIRRLAALVDRVQVSAGEKVFEKGDMGKSMYIVVDGCVRVHDGDVVLKHLNRGEVFGEIGALASETRTASITAETDSVLFRLDQDALYDTVAEQPDAARTVIQALCEKERTMVRDVTDRTIKVRVLERELEIGRQIQRGFLPDVLPDVPGWDLAAHLQPAREVAGDFYDFFLVRSLDCTGIVIGDVCDKGVGAALFMTLFRSLIRSTSLSADFIGWTGAPAPKADWVAGETRGTSARWANLRHSISLTNNYIASTHRNSSMFASVFFALLDPKTGELNYINAGHEAPVIVDANGVRQRLEPTGPVIGLFPNAVHDVATAQVRSGEVLVAYTDGVPEAKSENGAQFSEEKLLALVTQSSGSAEAMLSSIISEVASFAGAATRFDDITVLAVRRQPAH